MERAEEQGAIGRFGPGELPMKRSVAVALQGLRKLDGSIGGTSRELEPLVQNERIALVQEKWIAALVERG